jgi:hypothetical protein
VTSVKFDRWKCDDQNYRFGSVGEDANLIFWDFSFGALQKPKHPRVTTSPLLYKTESDSSPFIPVTPINIERKKSLRNHRFLRGFSSPENNNNAMNSGSFGGRFKRKPSRSNNMFTPQDFTDDMVEEQIKQHLPVLHPPLKKTQAAILLPTTTREVHPDPCLSLLFRENTIVTTDRRGRTFTWGRP